MAGWKQNTVLLALFLVSVQGVNIIVNDPSDSSIHPTRGCGNGEGEMCNFRTAWLTANPNDTIVLTVDIQMESAINYTAYDGAKNGTITLLGAVNGKARARVSPVSSKLNKIPFIQMNGWRFVLVVKNLEIANFAVTNVGGSKGQGAGAAICLNQGVGSQYGMACQGYPSGIPPGGRSAEVALDIPEPKPVVGDTPLPVGPLILSIQNSEFIENGYLNSSGVFGQGGAVFVYCQVGKPCQTTIENSYFRYNYIFTSESGAGGAALCSGPSTGFGVHPRCSMTVTDTVFEGNSINDVSARVALAQSGGSALGVFGQVNVSGGAFANNNGGANGGALWSLAQVADIRVWKTFFGNNKPAKNVVNTGAVISGNHLKLYNVHLINPTSSFPATYSPNDQYFSECNLENLDGKPVVLFGYQLYNRNPVNTNLMNTTFGAGFANCAEAASWLPCPTGTTCKNAHNGGSIVGYECI